MIISIYTRTLKSQLNNSCCPPMFCRGPMSHVDFLGRVRISYKSTSITGGHHLVLSIEPCSWIEACSWMKDIHQSLRAECSRFPCQANMAPIEIPTWVVSLVVFLKIGVPLNHPFIEGCSIVNQPFWDPPRLWQPAFTGENIEGRPSEYLLSAESCLALLVQCCEHVENGNIIWELQFRSLHAPWPHFWQDYITGFYLWRVYVYIPKDVPESIIGIQSMHFCDPASLIIIACSPMIAQKIFACIMPVLSELASFVEN